MSMHAGAVGRGGRAGISSMRRNRDILEHRIKKGTLPRMLTFAKVYRAMIMVFLTAVIFDSIVTSISPLVLRAIIDTITNTHVTHKSQNLVIGLALLTAVLALIDAGL